MRKSVPLILAVFLISFITFGQAPSPTPNDLAKYITDNYTKREVSIPMRDGVKLFTAIYEPKAKTEKYPILLSRTPYSIAPYGERMRTSLGPDELFAREGYIFVYQDVRGRWMSEGNFVEIRPETAQYKPGTTDESTDSYDTIDWLVKNVANNNGRVGIYGISYPGFYASAGSINSHPALKACSPQAPVSDWFHGDDQNHNGAIFLAQNYWFYTGFQPRPSPTSDRNYLKPWKGPDSQDSYDYFLKLGGLKEVADSYEKGLGVRMPFWDDMMEHPTYDQYWKDRNVLTHLNGVKCATMTVGGWFDNEDNYGAQNTYRHIEAQNPGIFNVLVMGPWSHGGWSRGNGDWLGTAYFGSKTSQYFRETFELPFFNHFLKDKGDISALKEVNVFDTGQNAWTSLDSWNPKASVTETPIYLNANGKLVWATPDATGSDEYISDPMHPVAYTQKIVRDYPADFMTEDQRFASQRPDVLTYQTEVLTDDISVAGDIKPNLFISSSGTDSDFIVKLIDVYPDDFRYEGGARPPITSGSIFFQPGGYQMLLRGEPMPARFRNSFEKPEPLKPNTATKLSFVMPGIVHTFKKGHRIMVQVQSTWFPLVGRNPQKYMENYLMGTQADFQKATERVFFGGKNASAIILPVVKK